jgi:hypothetical protein
VPLRRAHASSVLQAVWHMALSVPRCEARRLNPGQGWRHSFIGAPLETALLSKMSRNVVAAHLRTAAVGEAVHATVSFALFVSLSTTVIQGGTYA